MPWKEINLMDVRTEFVLKSLSKNVNFTRLCKEYGISTKTGYKFKKRFFEEGLAGLEDRSRKPKSKSKQYSENTICELIRLKNAYTHWGPKKIRNLFITNNPNREVPSLSTVKRILDKSGLVEHKKKRRQTKNERLQNQITPENPNELWTVDFKGWWNTPYNEKCEPLTIRDEYSKYILSLKILENSTTIAVKKEFERIFEVYGLPVTIKSDNGVPFASTQAILGLTRLSIWFVLLGIKLDRIRPGCPYENGAHERMHKDIKKELQGKINGDIKEHQRAFDIWRNEYNEIRPHEALSMKTPASIYTKSKIKYNGVPDEIIYPMNYLTRKVNRTGKICINGFEVFISTSFYGYHIGLKEINCYEFEAYFDNLLLGIIDMKTKKLNSIKINNKKKVSPMS